MIRAFQTFDLRPSAPSGNNPLNFDELIIDWGTLPPGSTAAIYWPGAGAAGVLKLANRRYAYHALTATDPHTIACPANGGMTYVPIPPQNGAKLAGLFTVLLPATVAQGQQFNVVVRRATTVTLPPPVVPPPLQSPPVNPAPALPGGVAGTGHAGRSVAKSWRTSTGAFQVNIPIKPAAATRPFDENTLAIFKWRLSVMPTANRWYPVLLRYIADPVGADRRAWRGRGRHRGIRRPALNGPAPGLGRGGDGGKPGPCHGHGEPIDLACVSGKVVEICYDCFGDLEGCRAGVLPTATRRSRPASAASRRCSSAPCGTALAWRFWWPRTRAGSPSS